MAQARYAIKAIKIKLALDRLSLAKENAVREHMGLPPQVSWMEECYTGFMQSLRSSFCELFTPCCVLPKPHLKIPDSSFDRICFPGTYENEIMKNCLGFGIGSITTTILYFIMVFQMDFSPLTSSLVCSFFGLLLTIGLAFSPQARLMTLLMVPQFFTSKGRTFLLMYAVMLVMTHPVQNYNRNILVMSESSTCGQELAFNQTRELMEAALSPIAGIMGTFKNLMEALKIFAVKIKEAFAALLVALKEIVSAFAALLKWLHSIVDVCKAKMGGPYERCGAAFETATKRCKDALGVLGFMCGILKAVSYVCEICNIPGVILCMISTLIKSLLPDQIFAPVKAAVMDIKKMFEFNVTINYDYEYNMTQTKTYSEVRKDIMNEVRERLSGFTNILPVMTNFALLTILFVFIRAILYRQKYLTNDKFDNFYITYKVMDIDQRRENMGKESIFPLTEKEEKKYIASNSFKMAKNEKRKVTKGVVVLCIAACHAAFYLMSDYGLWWLLDMMKKHLEIKTANNVPPHLKMHVQGNGAMADMYRALISMFDPIAEANIELDTTKCLPIPFEPNWAVYDEIYFIFGLCLFLILFESYGLRLRHIVCGMFFPNRETERAAWLYNHILKARGGFLKFERRKMRQTFKTKKAEEKGSIKGMLAAKYPILGKLFKYLGWERKLCLCCGREGRKGDMDGFSHCENSGCGAVYCVECFDDLHNLCTVCMKPIDYGDLSDFSEERDSSEDEEEFLKKKEEAKQKREERKAKAAENTHSRMLLRYGFVPGGTPEDALALTTKKENDSDAMSDDISVGLTEDSVSDDVLSVNTLNIENENERDKNTVK